MIKRAGTALADPAITCPTASLGEGLKRLRVLVLTPDFPPTYGGIQVLVHRLVQYCPFESEVVTIDATGASEFDRQGRQRVIRVSPMTMFGHRGSVGLLNARAVVEARRVRPDAVLSAHIVTSPGAFLIARMAKVPFVQYLHAQEVVERPRLARFAIRRAAAVIAVSRHTQQLASAHGAQPDRLHRIANGVDIPSGQRGERSARPLVLTVSRLHDRYKGHDVLIEALSLIRSRVPDVLWVVIGEGPLRPLYERMIRARDLDSHAQFIGSVDDATRDAWLDRAHVLAMPSRLSAGGGGEGFGIVYLEAAAHGLPVVAGGVAGALDAVVDGRTGLLVDPIDSAQIAKAIADLLLDPARADALGQAGALRARDFAWPRIANQVAEVFDAVVPSRR